MSGMPTGSTLLAYITTGVVPLLVGFGLINSDDPAAASDAALAAIAERPAAPFTADGPDSHEIHRAPDGLFYVTATVNGAQLRLIVDTGATVTVLTPADAAAIRLEPQAHQFQSSVSTVGGDAAMAWVRVEQMTVAGRTLPPIRAAVVQSNIETSLLGQDALAALGPITIDRDRLTIRR